MTKVSGSTQTQETKKTTTEEKKTVVQPQDEFKDVRATSILSDRLSSGLKEHINEDGIFKDERGRTSVGHLAKSIIADENGKLNPNDTKAAVVKMVADNPVLAAQAKELGVDLENPTWNDFQNCANLDIPAGQEIDVSGIQQGNLENKGDQANEAEETKNTGKTETTKNTGETKETGKSENTEKAGETKEATPAQATQKSQESKSQTDPGKVMELISQAEQLLQSNPEQAKQLASEAKGLIANLRASQQQNGQQQNTTTNNGQQSQGQQVAQQIQSGANIDVAQVDQVMQSGNADQIGQVLQALEGRCNKIMNGTASKTMNALNMLGQQNMAMNQIPFMNQAAA